MDVQQRQRETPQRDSRERADVAALALLVVDPSGSIALAEGAGLDAFGFASAVGQPFSRVLSRFPALSSAVEAAFSGRRSAATVTTAGRTFEVSVEACRKGGALVVGVDVTVERRRRELERDRQRELALIFRQVPGAVWSTDRDLVVTRAFGRVAAKLELNADAIVNKSIYDVLGARDPEDALVAAHREALTGARTSYRYEFRGRRFDIITEALRDDEQRLIGTVSAAIDVTTTFEAEERLAKSQALLADAQRVAHVGSWEWDIANDKLTWSDEMFAIYALAREQFVPTLEAFFEHVAPADLAATRKVVFDAVQRPGPFVYDHRAVRPDGSIRMLHTRGDVLVDRRGKPQRMLATCWDITDRWETNQRLERTASLLQASLEATVDGIVVVDVNGKTITAYNRRLLEMWSLPPRLVTDGDDGALRNYILDQVEDPDAFLKGVADLYAHPEKESFDVIRCRDGRVFERMSRPQRLGTEIVGRVWSFRDITERERLFRRAVFLSDAGRLLSSLDVEEALSSVAHLAVPYLGDNCAIDFLGEGVPRRLLALARGDTRSAVPELSPAVLAGRSSIYTSSAIGHMAVPLFVNGVVYGAMTFRAPPGRRYVASDLEVAEELGRRVSLALEKMQLLQHAREALHAREEFLAIAAHEIRGPVTSLHAAVQALLRKKLSEQGATRALELIEREDHRLARFVDELLDLGFTRAETATFEVERVNLARVVRDVIARNEDELARSGSALSLELDEHAVGMWNRERLEKVVATLFSNATKFGLGKPIEIAVAVRDGKAILSVLDHGIGIEPESMDRIFKPFERAVSVRNYGGLGLGLYIASSIVKGLGGTIHVESQPGVGSVFTVELELERSRA